MAEGDAPDPLDPLRRPLAAGVPLPALAVYARWWQLETYLRQLVYTELRAAYGTDWTKHLGARASGRAAHDRVNAYMASADADELLAYADASRLVKLIGDHWYLFEPVLLPRQRWDGLADVLGAIRNRIGHCRRPHDDDLARLEQALRDLEPGARDFYRSYNDVSYPDPKAKDPLVRAWLGRRHEDAARLVEHCRQQYDVRFRLGYSTRPWADVPENEDAISGSDGVLWQAQWILAAREVPPAELWPELRTSVRELIVHIVFDAATVTATFAAVDDADTIADAIGHFFDELIMASGPMPLPEPGDPLTQWREAWKEGAEQLPPKIQVGSALSLFDPLNPNAFSVFSA